MCSKLSSEDDSVKSDLIKSSDKQLTGSLKAKDNIERHCCIVSESILKSKRAKGSVLEAISWVVRDLGRFD